MLKHSNAMATIAVKDVEAARQFYEGQLGLEPAASEPGMLILRSGDSTVMVYQSAFAGTNKANLGHLERDRGHRRAGAHVAGAWRALPALRRHAGHHAPGRHPRFG